MSDGAGNGHDDRHGHEKHHGHDDRHGHDGHDGHDGHHKHDERHEQRRLASDRGDEEWVMAAVERAATSVRERVKDAPYLTLGAAVGVGLVVGGGAWHPVARSLVGLGARLAFSALVPALLDRVATRPGTEDDADRR